MVSLLQAPTTCKTRYIYYTLPKSKSKFLVQVQLRAKYKIVKAKVPNLWALG